MCVAAYGDPATTGDEISESSCTPPTDVLRLGQEEQYSEDEFSKDPWSCLATIGVGGECVFPSDREIFLDGSR
jgi:hypothetical protein